MGLVRACAKYVMMAFLVSCGLLVTVTFKCELGDMGGTRTTDLLSKTGA